MTDSDLSIAKRGTTKLVPLWKLYQNQCNLRVKTLIIDSICKFAAVKNGLYLIVSKICMINIPVCALNNGTASIKVKQKKNCVTVIGLLLIGMVTVTAALDNTESCGDFQSFLGKFETDKVYQLDHTNWPLYVANLSLCDDRGIPRIDKKSGQPYPKDWCRKDIQWDRFKNGVFIVRSLREQSHIQQTVKTEEKHATVTLACDSAYRSVCNNYWNKYFFSRDSLGCWQLVRWEQRTEN